MRPNQKNNNNRSRGRGRGNNGNKNQNPLNRSYDSNGPDVRIRGNASHIAEKYTALARDAIASGDGVMAENYYQHAEHYNRIIMAANAAREEEQRERELQREARNEQNNSADGENAGDEAASSEGDQEAPRRNPRRRRNSAETVEVSEAAESASDVDAGQDASAESEELKPRRRRKPAAKPVEPTENLAEAEQPVVDIPVSESSPEAAE